MWQINGKQKTTQQNCFKIILKGNSRNDRLLNENADHFHLLFTGTPGCLML